MPLQKDSIYAIYVEVRVVIDTNVIVSAMLSQGGASRQVIRHCFERRVSPLIGAVLFAEYEDVVSRPALFTQSPLTASERTELLDALLSVCAWQSIYYLWRPNLPDPGDDHVVELALAGGASWIVTANLRDFGRSELRFDALRIGTARTFLSELEDDR